jgi:hypothetical protein
VDDFFGAERQPQVRDFDLLLLRVGHHHFFRDRR